MRGRYYIYTLHEEQLLIAVGCRGKKQAGQKQRKERGRQRLT